MIREKIRLYGSRRGKAAGGLGRGRTRFNPGAAERAAAFEGCWRGVCASPGAGPREIAEDDGTANYGPSGAVRPAPLRRSNHRLGSEKAGQLVKVVGEPRRIARQQHPAILEERRLSLKTEDVSNPGRGQERAVNGEAPPPSIPLTVSWKPSFDEDRMHTGAERPHPVPCV